MNVDILAIGAHPDDVELSAAGTILKHLASGKTAAIVDLTQGELGTRGTKDTRHQEAQNASKILGLSERINLKMADGFFEQNQENLLKIIEVIRYFSPKIVLINAPSDRHPDHGKASKLISDACFLAGLPKVKTIFREQKQAAFRPNHVYQYIQDQYLTPSFVVDVTDFVDKKFESIFAYKTQFYNPDSEEPITPISSEEFIEFLKGRMSGFGRMIGAKYAEGFISIQPIEVKMFDI